MWPADPARVQPMLASTGHVPLDSPDFVYEPKYDGIRAIVAIEPSATSGTPRTPPRVRCWSRLGNEKSRQFPDVVDALSTVFAGRRRPILLDGEIVALDRHGRPTSFLHLQGRISVRGLRHRTEIGPVAFVAFDVLFDGDHDLRGQPLVARRQALQKIFAAVDSSIVRIGEQEPGGGRALQARAHAEGWEGLVAKRADSRYVSGKRSTDWCKLKLVRHQTCVIGGWTDPRGTRARFGALLLGVFDDDGTLRHVGQVGSGFSGQALDRIWTLLQARRRASPPFVDVPAALEGAHWTTPNLVCEVKFTEWTLDGRLRHPTYVGLRDDVDPRGVRREPESGERQTAQAHRRTPTRRRHTTATAVDDGLRRAPDARDIASVLDQIEALQHGPGRGTLHLPGDERLDVTNLDKVFWPDLHLTKADLLRHYLRMASAILPALDGRPLVLKRYPDGVRGKPFYQHRAAESVPAGVPVEHVEASDGTRPHIIGGSLFALLYTAQLGAISQDPWFSRLGTLDAIDAVAIDLDPPDGMPFRRVLDVAIRVREELVRLGTDGVLKTSGSRGLHVFVPMPAGTPYEAGLLYAQIVATVVAGRHAREATVERSLVARGRRVYLDYLQNMRGKTLASVYSVRANDWAGVSMPITWDEADAGVDPRAFTMATAPARLAAVGDLWAGLRRARPADVRAVLQYAEPTTPSTRSRARP
jgi:bifunctional non-homologous end joining protein LigD